MKFDIVRSKKSESIEERYFANERSFDCNISVNVDINVAIAYLNLGVDSDDMCVKCLWEFSPRESWKQADLTAPFAEYGELCLIGEYKAGLSWRLDTDKMWESYFDKLSGWYCIGNPLMEKNDKAVKIIKNMIAVVDKSNILKSVWIQPYLFRGILRLYRGMGLRG